MSGRLIGPKTWDGIVGIYGNRFGQFRNCFGWLFDNLYNKLWFGCFWVGNGHGFRFHLLGEWAAHGQPIAHLGTVKNSLGLLGWTKIGSCVFQAKYCLNWMAWNCVGNNMLMHEN